MFEDDRIHKEGPARRGLLVTMKHKGRGLNEENREGGQRRRKELVGWVQRAKEQGVGSCDWETARWKGGVRRKYEGALPKGLLWALLCVRLIGICSYESTNVIIPSIPVCNLE
jgi:hypothetical protein